jgi:release factor glutamine methyltransferase
MTEHIHFTQAPEIRAATTVRALFQALSLPRLEQLSLAAHALNVPRSWLLAHDLDTLMPQQIAAVHSLLTRRIAGEPVAYLLGQREFYGLLFHVSPAVLIPRPETELLVDYLIHYAPNAGRVLDLGTGSGAIAVSFAHHRPDCQVYATDISPAALDVARTNNQAHSDGRVDVRASDWCVAFFTSEYTNYFDIIVSNPPYIAADDAHLQQGDLRHEPIGALTDLADGLQCYRAIVLQALPRLKCSGFLVLEHGWQQGDAIAQLLQAAGYQAITQYCDQDEQGHSRMLVAQKP